MGILRFFASALSFVSSVSLNMTATQFLRDSGEGPEPEPLGRPAPARRPPQVDFFLAFRLIPARALGADFAVRFAFIVRLAAILYSRQVLDGCAGVWALSTDDPA